MKNKRIFNLVFWALVAICIMIATYFAWSKDGEYRVIHFFASFIFDFGFCMVLAFWCDDLIKRGNKVQEINEEDLTLKTFEDLSFVPIYEPEGDTDSSLSKFYDGCYQAYMEFDNGYGISVLLGRLYYSNGVNTYEVGTMYKGELFTMDGQDDEVIGYRTEQEVTEIMRKLQKM